MAERDPEAASLTDDELAARLRALGERLTPVPIEAELRAWAEHDQWVASTNAVLSDEAIDRWLELSARNGAHCREHRPTSTVALASVMSSRSRCVRTTSLILNGCGGCMPGARVEGGMLGVE